MAKQLSSAGRARAALLRYEAAQIEARAGEEKALKAAHAVTIALLQRLSVVLGPFDPYRVDEPEYGAVSRDRCVWRCVYEFKLGKNEELVCDEGPMVTATNEFLDYTGGVQSVLLLRTQWYGQPLPARELRLGLRLEDGKESVIALCEDGNPRPYKEVLLSLMDMAEQACMARGLSVDVDGP